MHVRFFPTPAAAAAAARDINEKIRVANLKPYKDESGEEVEGVIETLREMRRKPVIKPVLKTPAVAAPVAAPVRKAPVIRALKR